MRKSLGTTVGTTQYQFQPLVVPVVVFRPLGTRASCLGAALAFTGSQKLIMAVVGWVAVVALLVWPIVRPKRYSSSEMATLDAKKRLMRELHEQSPD